ncbi:uncharacterized protein A1O9_01070 [Exophiala aquamarina CBS 119918]|uniref:Mediator of RNA polymerase II transcription subunit 8 n=1 Tax=Exophiala aquamarina CBS 119918 TaxID=1182545 RepID=A0A072PSK8_9EURO|nr:uncharacterized protein A1O9_01070 [Exophiala aquamarina CBS 119918]KEF63094.1 hypothetical protein A1O9_01070 [Exophiala aquamarina CBS 119918]
MAALDNDQVRSLDQTRQLLLSLHTSLVALRSDISQNPQLPSWPALQTHANLISSNLQTITESLSRHRDAFSSAVVHPLPQFPAKERAFILETLLRTKFEPNIEEWVEEGEAVASRQHRPAQRGLTDADRDALWQWAPGAANAEARKQKWGADYTLEEKQNGIENVTTGLRRELIEPPDDEGAEDDDDDEEYDEVTDDENDAEDKMDVEQSKSEATPSSTEIKPPSLHTAQMPLATLHRFMTTGR